MDHLYIAHRLGGRGLVSVFHCVKAEEHALGRYIGSTDEPLLRMVASQNWFPTESDSGKQYMARVKCDLHNNYTGKALRGQFARDMTNLVDTKYQWKWLQCSGISRYVSRGFAFCCSRTGHPYQHN